jgi:hypothetical protein
MKKIIYLLIIISVSSCATSGNCPTTNKKYFTKGVKGSKPLYKGYGGKNSNKMYKCK